MLPHFRYQGKRKETVKREKAKKKNPEEILPSVAFITIEDST
jgi:hypothetical protein